MLSCGTQYSQCAMLFCISYVKLKYSQLLNTIIFYIQSAFNSNLFLSKDKNFTILRLTHQLRLHHWLFPVEQSKNKGVVLMPLELKTSQAQRLGWNKGSSSFQKILSSVTLRL